VCAADDDSCDGAEWRSSIRRLSPSERASETRRRPVAWSQHRTTDTPVVTPDQLGATPIEGPLLVETAYTTLAVGPATLLHDHGGHVVVTFTETVA
jgi:hypothetical protein